MTTGNTALIRHLVRFNGHDTGTVRPVAAEDAEFWIENGLAVPAEESEIDDKGDAEEEEAKRKAEGKPEKDKMAKGADKK